MGTACGVKSCDPMLESCDFGRAGPVRAMSRLKQSGTTTTNSSSEHAVLDPVFMTCVGGREELRERETGRKRERERGTEG